jgi:hypothetical protein
MADQSTLRNQRSGDFHRNVAPPIPFKKRKGKEKSDSRKDLTFSVLINSASNDEITKHNSVSLHVSTFDTGTPEEYCAWRESIDSLIQRKKCNTYLERYNIYKTVFSGTSLETFNAKHDEFNESQPAPAPSIKRQSNSC